MKNKNENSIDQLFSEKLRNHSAKPRDLVWENLDKELGKKKGGTYGDFWALGTLFSVLILGAGAMYFAEPSDQKNQVIEQKTKINILSEVQKETKKEELNKSNKHKENIESTFSLNKQKEEKNHSAIQTNTIHKTNKNAINLSTKKEKNNKTIKKQEVATLQTPVKEEEAITNKTIEKENSEELEDVNEKEVQKIVKNEEVEKKNALETQEVKKAGVHVKIRLGTQAGGRDEEREEIEAEEKANKKSRLLGKVLKGAWNLKKEKKLGKNKK